MLIFGVICATIALVAICGFFPGFFFVRRLRWTPLEKLCGGAGLSLVLLYLAAWTIYCFGPRNQRPAYWAVAGACAILAVLSARDALRLFRSFRVRQTLLAMGFLLVWTFAMLGMIRVYSGAAWAGDWAEHFQRALFFLDRLPLSTPILEIYALPARPPMQNVLAAFFLGLAGDRFEIFQAIFACLNLLAFLPCVLLMPALGFRKRRAMVPLAAIFAASPVVMENATYAWTKSLTAFYVVLAIALYLAGWRKSDRIRTAAAFLALAAGALTHYSAAPYLIVIGLHYAVRLLRARPIAWRDGVAAFAPAIPLLATWFGWSFQVYGARTTLTSNTSITTAEQYRGSAVERIAGNLFDTVAPVWLRVESPLWEQPNAEGRLRDQAFATYQVNLVFAMGSVGGLVVLWLLYGRLIRGREGRERPFWRILIPSAVVLGIAAVGERDRLGVGHLTLLALQISGLTALASAFPRLGRPLRLAIVLGCCLDFGLGVFLHARVQSLENTPGHPVFPELVYRGGGQFAMTDPQPDSLFPKAWDNWKLKRRDEAAERWMRDLPRGHESDPQFNAAWPGIRKQLQATIDKDAAEWGGWQARHGGALTHLGDHVDTDAAAALFLALFAAGLWLFGRQALAAAPARAARAPATPPRTAKSSRARR